MLLTARFILFLLYLATASNGQETSSSVVSNKNSDQQSNILVNAKPENLPNATWTILDIDADSRENLCQRQIAHCSNNCGGPSSAPQNFCNSTTMAWNCGCANKVPDLTPYLWPVTQAECIGKAQNCLSICNNKSAASTGPCSFACQIYYQCSTNRAPARYLRTDNSDDVPASYDGPPAPKQHVDSNNATSRSSNNSASTNSTSYSSNQQSSMAYTVLNASIYESTLLVLLFVATFSLM